MPKKWIYPRYPLKSKIASLAQDLYLKPIVATLLLQRGVHSTQEAQAFLKPSIEMLHNPMLMKGMKVAVVRLAQAIDRKELICIYGDYDVDGTTSVAMLYQVLTRLGAHSYFYIPDRHKEGYGLSQKGVDQSLVRKAKVLLCIDCGTKAVDLIHQAQMGGIDVIVCDHHEPGSVLPPTLAMLNPKQADCPYPYKELSACGIGYKLLQGLALYKNLDASILEDCLDLVVVSIAADIVPMNGENRLLAFCGLQKLNMSGRKGLVALIQQIGRPSPLSIADIVFGIAPCINAAGRMVHAEAAVWLFLAEDDKVASEWAKFLCEQNTLRKEMDKKMTGEALCMIDKEKKNDKKKHYTHVLYKKDWHKGILGIVASRCVEHCYRPTILLTQDKNQITGSARSVVGYNLYKALQVCSPLLARYGGHAYAAGLTLSYSNLEAFRKKFEQTVATTMQEEKCLPSQHVDLRLRFADIDINLYRAIQQLAPFGPGHRKPVFETYPVIACKHWIYQQKHLKIHVQEQGDKQIWEAIGFNMASYVTYIQDRKPFAIAYTLQTKTFRKVEGLQLVLKDIKPIYKKI